MDKKYISVHALNSYLKAKFDSDYQLQDVYIKGEISNYRPHPSGHLYFTLKDEKASMNAIMFASYANKSKVKVTNGMKVMIRCHVSIYEKTGQSQLYITEMEEDGIGNLFLRFEELREKLYKEGLFDIEHKKEIPSYPQTIAVLSAKQGAALQDTLRTLKSRYPVARVYIFPIPVQGKNAFQYIIQTLKGIDNSGFSTILLVRGGGSIEDLWNFNEEELVRCIYQLKTPIITGIGHETDFTLVDFVSDLRAITPTDAANKATPDINELSSQLQYKKQRLSALFEHRIDLEKKHLDHIRHSYVFKNPTRIYENELLRLHHYQEWLDQYALIFKQYAQHIVYQKDILDKNMSQFLEKNRYTFQQKIEKLDLVSPLKILSKGYTLIKKEETIIKNKNDIQSGDEVSIIFHDGKRNATIQ